MSKLEPMIEWLSELMKFSVSNSQLSYSAEKFLRSKETVDTNRNEKINEQISNKNYESPKKKKIIDYNSNISIILCENV